MLRLKIDYGHEFISNRIKDELILNDIFDFQETEKNILKEMNNIFEMDIEINKDINHLSGGQRSLAFLVTLCHIIKKKNIPKAEIQIDNIKESLTSQKYQLLTEYLSERGIDVIR